MAGKQAKVLSDKHVKDLLFFAANSPHPERNRLIVLFSVKAGLRAGEIAQLTWEMVLDPSGQVSNAIELQDWAAKKRSGRTIPLHADLKSALSDWRSSQMPVGSVIQSERGGAMTPQSIVVWFNRAFHYMGLEGCSSHSGR